MPVFGSHHRVIIVHNPGLPSETRREARMGGDSDRKALFYLEDRVQTGDQIQYEYFDEPRVIVRVIPEQTMSGPSHWRAEMMPLSEWRRRNAPLVSHVHVEGQGARININSVDQSVQQFQNDSRQQAVLDVLDGLKGAIEQLDLPAADRADAKIAAE